MRSMPLKSILCLLLALIANASISYGQQTDKLNRPMLIKDGKTSQTFFRTTEWMDFKHPPDSIRVRIGTGTVSLPFLVPMHPTSEQQTVSFHYFIPIVFYQYLLSALFTCLLICSIIILPIVSWLKIRGEDVLIVIMIFLGLGITMVGILFAIDAIFPIRDTTIYFDNATGASYVLRLKEKDIHVPANAHVPVRLKSGLHAIEILNEKGHLVVPRTTIKLEPSGIHVYNILGVNTYTVIQYHYR